VIGEDALQEAYDLLNKDRNIDYGGTDSSFPKLATMWTLLLQDKLATEERVTETDVAMLMSALKLLRISANPHKMDSWVDLIGYAAIGSDFVEDE